MKHSSKTFACSAALLVLAGAAHAQATPPAAGAQPPQRDLLDTTCGDYLQGLQAARPGDKATAAQKRRAQEVQDDITSALMWVHGYTSARAADGKFPPLTQAWMRETVVRLAQSCKAHSPDGKMRLADAASKL